MPENQNDTLTKLVTADETWKILALSLYTADPDDPIRKSVAAWKLLARPDKFVG